MSETDFRNALASDPALMPQPDAAPEPDTNDVTCPTCGASAKRIAESSAPDPGMNTPAPGAPPLA